MADILDTFADLLRATLVLGSSETKQKIEEAIDRYEHIRSRTIVLTFEKAVPIACGGFAILDARQGAPSLNVFCAGGVDPEEHEYASCPLPKLPGPEVFQ